MVSKSRVKFYSRTGDIQFSRKTVRQWVLPLLKRIDVVDYPTQVGNIIGLGKQHTWYYVHKLEKCNLIRREKRGNVVIYELTEESKNLLRSCEGTVFPAQLYRFDKCQVAYEILTEGRYPKGSFRPVEMVNWTALLGTELGVKVKHTPRNWIVHVEVIQGRNAIEVTNLAMNLANRVRNALCTKYGCVLGDGQVIAGEIAHEDPIATLFGRFFTVRANNRKIDHSWGPGELEHTQRDAVINYLQMPEGVKNTKAEVLAMRNDVRMLFGEVVGLRSDVAVLHSDVAGLRSEVIKVLQEITLMVTTFSEALGVAKKLNETEAKNQPDAKSPQIEGGQNKYVA